MSQQTIRQQARRTAREMAERRRRERLNREARTIALAEQVMVAIGERDAAVAAAEKRAGTALHQLTDAEGLSLKDAIEWCGKTLTAREATRLMRMVVEDLEAAQSLRHGCAKPERLSAHADVDGKAG
jgi:hypothetical protein